MKTLNFLFAGSLACSSMAAQDAYQIDPIHLAFVENYKHLWTKVVVYDSVDV